MEKLVGILRAYPWGSHSLIAQLQGRPVPAAKPEAEVWFGAHPLSPSTIAGEGLDALIAEDPAGALGPRVRAEFGDKLPFLLKLLAADEPLSIQAHPSKEQAEEGFARENAAGLALDSPDRNYRDANHKPELVVALTEFHALAGFRPLPLTQELFDALSSPTLDRYAAMIDPAREEESLRALFTTWISIPAQRRGELIAEVRTGAEARAAEQTWIGRTARNFLSIAQQYPNDPGALVALLLNHVEMQPGQGLFLAAGQLHAYLRGMGVEIMASSDNVLRGGLTTKHVDVPELVRILQFTPAPEPFVETRELGPGAVGYDVPCADFQLSRHALAAGESLELSDGGPAIVLCTSGAVRAGGVDLGPGEAAWAPASEGGASVSARGGDADVFYARVRS
ncbi:mannose-6-phosphate isomerase, class I [uncultured Corynebacterium sp.]|uniref:mannose-6-phosphate isomerase, class I n=1 Tax=uncultured Corynebacterium sp. TaxID=159447 RepID=UPI00259771E5|nr:mannose-6-phosphate isomerase, class I [uncultured Corynebacterium sp.]